MKDEVKIWYVAAAYFVLYGACVLMFYPIFSPDVVNRYAPMAEEFAQGNWPLAFHPRFGVFFQCLTGGIALFGMRGDLACQLGSILMLALAAVPTWHLVRDMFGAKAAWLAVLFVLLCDDFARYAADGLRDTGKCLAFALIALGFVRQDVRWLSTGIFILATLVAYGFPVAAVLLLFWCLRCLWRHAPGKIIVPCITIVVAFFCDAAMVHYFTGHWLPNAGLIRILGRWL